MAVSKVVARFKSGDAMKGKTSDFFPNKRYFHIEPIDGEPVEIDIEELKALFFVKDWDGDTDRNYAYNDVIAGGGRKIEVTFADGESLIGYSQGYSPNRPGFFIIPADINGNNERVYIISSATKEVRFITS